MSKITEDIIEKVESLEYIIEDLKTENKELINSNISLKEELEELEEDRIERNYVDKQNDLMLRTIIQELKEKLGKEL